MIRRGFCFLIPELKNKTATLPDIFHFPMEAVQKHSVPQRLLQHSQSRGCYYITKQTKPQRVKDKTQQSKATKSHLKQTLQREEVLHIQTELSILSHCCWLVRWHRNTHPIIQQPLEPFCARGHGLSLWANLSSWGGAERGEGPLHSMTPPN